MFPPRTNQPAKPRRRAVKQLAVFVLDAGLGMYVSPNRTGNTTLTMDGCKLNQLTDARPTQGHTLSSRH